MTINPGAEWRRCATGVTVPYSAEFRDRGPNEALLAQLAAVVPKDGPPGQTIENKEAPESFLSPDSIAKLHAVNTFRHDLPRATSSQEIWHWLIPAGELRFLGRRFHSPREYQYELAAAAVDAGLGRHSPPPARPRPAAIHRASRRAARRRWPDNYEQVRAATRFEMPSQPPADLEKPLEELAPPPPPPAGGQQPSLRPEKAGRELHRTVVESQEEGDGRSGNSS